MSTKSKHEKKINVINRTTSETLRLGEADLSLRTTNSIQSSLPSSRKKIQTSSSSFQITGVSLTRSDFGDDSADDLDESHTDDISRVTDNETPSFSEDSRDIDDHTEQTTNCEPAKLKLAEDSGTRFKFVKIPSVTPFSRGRWTCFDYLDNTEQIQSSVHPQNLQVQRSTQGACLPSSSNYSHLLMREPLFYGYPQNLSNLAPPKSNQLSRPAVQLYQEIEQSKEDKSSCKVKVDNGGDILSDIKVALTSASIASNSQSPANNNNIDRKIEEALDAVKTHLMLAVHKEVDFLKTRVSTLEGRVNELEIENSILRVNYLLFKS